MSPAARRIFTRGIAVGLVILTLLIAACACLEISAAREYERAGFHQVNGRWIP